MKFSSTVEHDEQLNCGCDKCKNLTV